MKLSVSITPESLFDFGVRQIVAKGYATEEEVRKNPKKAWSSYVQDLIRADMQASNRKPKKENGVAAPVSVNRFGTKLIKKLNT